MAITHSMAMVEVLFGVLLFVLPASLLLEVLAAPLLGVVLLPVLLLPLPVLLLLLDESLVQHSIPSFKHSVHGVVLGLATNALPQ